MGERSGRAAVALAVALTIVPQGGCSFAFVKPVKRDGDAVNHVCTTNHWAPSLDLLFTSTNVAAIVYVLGEDLPDQTKTRAVTSGVSVAALWLASSIYGWVNTSECRALKFVPADDPTVPRKRVVVTRVPRPAPQPGSSSGAAPAIAGPPTSPSPPPEASPAGAVLSPAGTPAVAPPPSAPPATPDARQRGDDEDPSRQR